ncbi:MAG: hypothetical protein ACYTGQ_03115 [Planctomycetota bacterium]|jgi:hypothetical protein
MSSIANTPEPPCDAVIYTNVQTEAQARGRDAWYERYKTRICKVVCDYGFNLD